MVNALLCRENHAIDRDQPISQVRTMDELMGSAVAERRLSTTRLALRRASRCCFAALVSTALIMSFDVTAATQEMGSADGLGAARGSVLSLVVVKA